LFAGTYGIGMFRSTDRSQAGEKVNNGLLAIYESCLEIDLNGHICVGTDVVGGAGGVFRSTDNGESWVELRLGIPAHP